MTPEQFCYWLQGFSEIRGCPPSSPEWQIIQDHLKTVFNKVTPSYPGYPSNPFPNKGLLDLEKIKATC